jgi:hypothetical protein
MNKIFLSFFLAAFVLFGTCSHAHATDWDFLGRNNLGTVYYDKYGIRQLPGNIIRVRVKIAYSSEGVNEVRESFPFIAASETVSYTLYTYEVKCHDSSFRIMRATTYNSSWEAIKRTDLDYAETGELSWDHVTPDSIVSVLSEKSCRYLLYNRP